MSEVSEGVEVESGRPETFAAMREQQAAEERERQARIAKGLPPEEVKLELSSEEIQLGHPGPKKIPLNEKQKLARATKMESGLTREDLLKTLNEGEVLLGKPGPALPHHIAVRNLAAINEELERAEAELEAETDSNEVAPEEPEQASEPELDAAEEFPAEELQGDETVPVDANGTPFDPVLHARDADGNPKLTKAGNWWKRPDANGG